MAQNYANLAGKVRPSKVTTRTAQTAPIAGREAEQVQNPAGGYSFEADSWARLDRFLILGVPGNSIYQSQTDLVKENADMIEQLLAQDGIRVVSTAAEVLRESRAMKVDAPLFVLAMAASSKNEATRSQALYVLPSVVRIPTHLFIFVGYVNAMRGWGRGLRRAVASYYTDTELGKLAMHSWKYKQREGWSHRDVLRLSHANTDDEHRNAVLRYMVKGELPADFAGVDALDQIMAADVLRQTTSPEMAAKLIRDHRLTREAVPTNLLNETKVWDALLEEMPVTAMVRNLGKMASLGMTGPMSDAEKLIVAKLTDADQIKRSHIHPMALFIAAKTYAKGAGVKGSLSWSPNGNIGDALDDAFYAAFDNVERTGKRILIAVDDSGSMRSGYGNSVMGGIMSANEAASAMALVTYMVEPNVALIGYSDDYSEISISRKARIVDLIKAIKSKGSGTNTAMPVHYARDKNMDFDAIVSYTDNNTWSGGYGYGRRPGHVTEVLRDYQRKVGHPVRFANLAMESNNITDVDPTNPNMFEIAGLASNTPQIIAEFVAGRI